MSVNSTMSPDEQFLKLEPGRVRRKHAKSRMGCRRCKSRKVKCSEQRPRCSACVFRNEVCEYRPDANDYRPDNGLESPASLQHAVSGHLDMELMFQYGHGTFSTLDDGTVSEERMSLLRPPTLLKYDFLRLLMLALSAVHIAYLDPARASQYTDIAIAYQNHALSTFKLPRESDIEACLATFWFSVILGILHLALAGHDRQPSVLPTLEEVADLWRGTDSLRHSARTTYNKQTYESNFGKSNVKRKDLTARTRVILGELSSACEEIATGAHWQRCGLEHSAKVAAYEHAMAQFSNVIESDTELAWPVLVSHDFFTLLANEDIGARLITMFFSLLIRNRYKQQWWVQNFSEAIVTELRDGLYRVHPLVEKMLSWAQIEAAIDTEHRGTNVLIEPQFDA